MSASARITHKVTAYHWRHNRRSARSKLMMCDCGWREAMIRKTEWTCRLRNLVGLCWLRGHAWDLPMAAHVGPVGFDESDDTFIDEMRQCDRCYHCQWLKVPASERQRGS